jgi:hypothetical protein
MKLDFHHLSDNNTNYLHHLIHAWGIAIILIVHGIFPFLFSTYASDKIIKNANNKKNRE